MSGGVGCDAGPRCRQAGCLYRGMAEGSDGRGRSEGDRPRAVRGDRFRGPGGLGQTCVWTEYGGDKVLFENFSFKLETENFSDLKFSSEIIPTPSILPLPSVEASFTMFETFSGEFKKPTILYE